MNKIVEVAKTIDEAIQAGLKALGVKEKDVEINILVEPKKGFFGFGAKDAKVELTLKNGLDNELASDKKDPIEDGKKFLMEVLTAMNLDVQIEESDLDGQKLFNIVGDNLGVLIGRRGQTLDALQYLLNISSNSKTNQNVRFVLDAENYRDRRKKTLENLADRLADKARRYKKDVVLEPMSPYERKIIHTHLQEERGIFTRSQGQEPFRKIVISTKKANGSGK